MIWSDCLAVVRRFRKILAGAEVKLNPPNADLWTQIAEDVRCGCSVSITKVAAHQDVGLARTPLEEWSFVHNKFADRAAARANDRRGSDFWHLLARHSQACRIVDEWNATIQQVLLHISRKVLQHGKIDKPDPQVPLSPSVPAWNGLPAQPPTPGGAVRWYGPKVVTKVVTWLWSAAEDARGPVVWISNAQLYVDYVLNTGDAGPIHLEGWRDSADYPLHALQQIGFKERARWFGKVLREILRHAGIQVESSYCRPASLMVCMYASCLALPWCAQRLEAVDKWMQSFGQGPFRRQSKAMDHLPGPVTLQSQQ